MNINNSLNPASAAITPGKMPAFMMGRIRQNNLLTRILTYLFVAFMIYVFTDGALFQQREISDLTDFVSNSGEGDSTRQVFYLTVAALIFFLESRRGLGGMLRMFPLSLFLLVSWCILTSTWAIDPSISFRRVILATIVIFATIAIVDLIGPVNITVLLYRVLVGLLLANLLSVIIVPKLAVHGPLEPDTALIGAWHGVMPHKNIASAVTALSCILFGYRAFLQRSWRYALLLVLALVFLFGTRGKTSLGFVIPALLASILYYYSYSMRGGRTLVISVIFGLFATGCLLALVFAGKIESVFSDPESFTGRVAIWEIVMRYVHGHPWTGAGFGSFWMIGDASPILKIGGDMPWLFGIAHSHDGYLEMLVTTGVPGLAMTVFALVVLPLYRFVVADGRYRTINGVYFGIWLFSVMYNLLETHIMNRDRQVWVIMLIAVEINFIIHQHTKRERKTRALARNHAASNFSRHPIVQPGAAD